MTPTITLWPDPMQGPGPDTQTVDETGRIRCVSVPRLVPYLPPEGKGNGTAILVCPGGAYTLLAWTSHVERLARYFNPLGIAVIGLAYRTAPPSRNMPADALSDLDRALDIVRANAGEWRIDQDRVVGLGFSAGANLLLQYSCSGNRGPARLKYMALLCLWPFNKPAEAYPVGPGAPSAFLCATEEDETAPAGFSRAIAVKLQEAGQDAVIKVFPKGNHLAFNFAETGPEVDWTPDFMAWLREKGLLALPSTP